MKCYCIVVLIWSFLTTNDVKHISCAFGHLYCVCVCVCEKTVHIMFQWLCNKPSRKLVAYDKTIYLLTSCTLNWASLGISFTPYDLDCSHLEAQLGLEIKVGLIYMSCAPAGTAGTAGGWPGSPLKWPNHFTLWLKVPRWSLQRRQKPIASTCHLPSC